MSFLCPDFFVSKPYLTCQILKMPLLNHASIPRVSLPWDCTTTHSTALGSPQGSPQPPKAILVCFSGVCGNMHTLPSAQEIQSISPSLGEACARLSMDWEGGGVKAKWQEKEFRIAEKAELEKGRTKPEMEISSESPGKPLQEDKPIGSSKSLSHACSL